MKLKQWTAPGLLICLALCGCTSQTAVQSETEEINETEKADQTGESECLSEEDITVNETVENSEDNGHAIEVSGESAFYHNVLVTKTGDGEGDEADFYGENAAVYAHDGGTLDLSEMVIKTNGTHANAVFSYGTGTTMNIENSYIFTEGNCSGGLMTTGGGTMNAANLTIHTTGRSSAAIRSDRGGGIVNVTGGSYTTDGTGSPVIYSTADITVSDAELTSTSSQGVVVEGENSVTLNNVDLSASNTSKNSDKSDFYQAVMIYQSMSGDADEGRAAFTMNGGKLTNLNGDVFFVNNTTALITLNAAEIINEADGVFLRAAAAGWGTEGNNGGHVDLEADDQKINGDILVDSVSTLNLYLANASIWNGTVNPEGENGEVYVELSGGSKWILSGDAYITSLTCDADAIDLNGHKLYVNGQEYQAETASEGQAIEVQISASQGGKPDGKPPEMPDGEHGHKPGEGKEPPEKPDGEN